jgi:hypothetical protein
MANKTAAKNAVDNAAAAAKNEIDLALPAGVNIVDGNISFNPTRITLVMDAGGNQATAESWRDSIKGYLDSVPRTYTAKSFVGRREGDSEHFIIIISALATYRINNF